MNLIEQLGGYEKAKKLVDDCKRYGRSDVKVPVNGGFIHIVADFLELDLLEYRRQHNIYEVGDRIVKASRLNDDKVYQVFEVADSLNWVKTSCGAFIDAPMFKHATDAEIKAGKRL